MKEDSPNILIKLGPKSDDVEQSNADDTPGPEKRQDTGHEVVLSDIEARNPRWAAVESTKDQDWTLYGMKGNWLRCVLRDPSHPEFPEQSKWKAPEALNEWGWSDAFADLPEEFEGDAYHSSSKVFGPERQLLDEQDEREGLLFSYDHLRWYNGDDGEAGKRYPVRALLRTCFEKGDC